jgi:hypothetical protein
MDELRSELTDLGMLRGTEGSVPTPDASGELVKELRFNSDRAFGPSLRRAPDEWGRLAADWMVLVPKIYPFERLIQYAGEDNITRSVILRPHLFSTGKSNAVADAESMLPEGRGERQARVYSLWKDGAFGMPASPQALDKLYDLMRFPHLARAAKPGGIDRITAEQENGQLVQGTNAMEIPVFEWYDHMVHLDVHERFMKSPEFKKLDPVMQEQFVLHRQAHLASAVPPMMDPAMPGPGGGAGPSGGGGRMQPPPPLFPGTPSAPDSVDPGSMPGAM